MNPINSRDLTWTDYFRHLTEEQSLNKMDLLLFSTILVFRDLESIIIVLIFTV